MAEAIAKEVFPERLVFEIRVSSAGTSASGGAPASEYSEVTARAHDLDLADHRANMLTKQRVEEADLIITMGAQHRETVGRLDASALKHTYLLTDFSDGLTGDVPDPIGGDQQFYEATYSVMRECIEGLAERLVNFDGWKAQE